MGGLAIDNPVRARRSLRLSSKYSAGALPNEGQLARRSNQQRSRYPLQRETSRGKRPRSQVRHARDLAEVELVAVRAAGLVEVGRLATMWGGERPSKLRPLRADGSARPPPEPAQAVGVQGVWVLAVCDQALHPLDELILREGWSRTNGNVRDGEPACRRLGCPARRPSGVKSAEKAAPHDCAKMCRPCPKQAEHHFRARARGSWRPLKPCLLATRHCAKSRS